MQLRRSGRKVRCVIPIASSEESLDRANRELKLDLDPRNVIDYLNFYYAFTPKEDPVSPRFWGSAQFAVPQTVEDLEYGAPRKSRLFLSLPTCSKTGAVKIALRSVPYGTSWTQQAIRTSSRFVVSRERARTPAFQARCAFNWSMHCLQRTSGF